MSIYPEISLIEGTNEHDLEDADQKGLFALDVKLNAHDTVRVHFMKLDHFVKGARYEEEQGRCYILSETVILTKLTKEKMYDAIHFMFKNGYLTAQKMKLSI